MTRAGGRMRSMDAGLAGCKEGRMGAESSESTASYSSCCMSEHKSASNTRPFHPPHVPSAIPVVHGSSTSGDKHLGRSQIYQEREYSMTWHVTGKAKRGFQEQGSLSTTPSALPCQNAHDHFHNPHYPPLIQIRPSHSQLICPVDLEDVAIYPKS